MCKVTKNPRKIWARAACLYALKKKADEVNKKVRKANDLLSQARSSNYISGVNGVVYEVLTSLTWNFPEVRESAELINLEDIPFAEETLKMFNDTVAKAEAAIPEAQSAIAGKEAKKQELQAELKKVKDEIKEIASKKTPTYTISFKGNEWSIEGNRSGSKPRKFDRTHPTFPSSLENVYWTYWFSFDASPYLDRYDLSTDRQQTAENDGLGIVALKNKIMNMGYLDRSDLGSFSIYTIPSELMSKHSSIESQISKLS